MPTNRVKPPRQHSLSGVEKQFRAHTLRSLAAFVKTSPLVPGGVPGGLGFMRPYPVYISRGEGCYVYDADGRRLLDMFNGDWVLPLGHNHPKVREAILKQMQNGLIFGMPPNELAYKFARMMQRRVPSVERMRFTTSGTEATLFALRLARAFTGKSKIAKMDGGYHGTHDSVMVATGWRDLGLLPGVEQNVTVLPFNQADACEALIEKEKDQLAAVIVEPVLGGAGLIAAKPEFLHRLREITRRHGIILIFDEVATFSLARGGAQELYGVTPDLTTISKPIGGGLPLGLFGGRADIMDLVDPALPGGAHMLHGATFGGHPLALAGGIAYLKAMTPPIYRKLHHLGDRLRQGIKELAAKHEVPLQATGLGHMFGLHWTHHAVVDAETAATSDRQVMRELFLSLLCKGFLLTPPRLGFLSAAMTDRHIDQFLVAADEALVENDLSNLQSPER